MSSMRTKRLGRELAMVRQLDIVDSVDIPDQDIGTWQVLLKAKSMPDYIGALRLDIAFPENFPFKPPCIKIPTIFHPNVYPDGRLCISTLDAGKSPGGGSNIITWRPSLSISNILTGVLYLMEMPNPGSPANVDAGKMYSKDKSGYEEKNTSLKNIRVERYSREKVLKEQQESYDQALLMDNLKEVETSEVLNNKVEETAKSVMEAQKESHKLAPSEDEDILDGFHVQQPIRTRLGSQLFKFKSERDEQTSIGDLKKALKRKWPGIDVQLRAKKQNKIQDLDDDEEILSTFKADIIYVDEI